MDGNNVQTSNVTIVKKQSRFKSWGLWLSIAALAVWCIKTFAGVDVSTQVNEGLNILLPVLVGFGIVNNPTDSENI